ncbi:tudor and KH domain-containing protein homolog [Toxorhynchites rutilus septentrionalis]|uniref:tudor and KH domain-containing protein homolog n=1 Tax=Toxorhynchites rutilus septentrionalis TaxID=329112 RepID=UPI00247A5ED2|nr:tudor and KH domain-containing protein homolog [Toxorhynchites rutilus septentrionalis]XP_055642441.1 tudor and KH domain-containing protein homolog [Toxorhynchites rutilus septentrionalis]XP_055642442.1 tudor and KH domain-containing protein homolog [Toxorhynchites rutilus septentrionalis]XP_055642443.1 tudor and KH domain-containing protein homolog [Toxorhynchites rutilus septentrionalis]XP_055642444.1 tudor and KH domain-containing protein homolog [Toxorhynchites rutilus septentrionalis]
MIKSPVAVPIIVGISLLSVGTAFVYAYLTKKKEDDQNSETASNRFSNQVSKLVRMLSKDESKTVEITLSNKIVPLVVGRKGYTLKHIQECTHTEICFREKDESYQICEIHGTEAGIRKAEELIKKEASRQITLTEEILVPQTACGKILGRCGDALQEICRKSMAKVWIEGTRIRGESRRVMITGTQNQINVAKSLIEQKVKDDADFRKSQEQLDMRREPRIRTPPNSITATPIPREIPPPTVEKLRSTSSSGQLEVFVSAVVSPSRFYLQLVGPQSAELDILVETMTEYYNQVENQEIHRIRKPYLGQIVAAEFNADNKWYRAEIVAILPNEFKPGEVVLDLYFVDYGDNQYIQPSDAYELRPDFLALRFQAIECFLAHVEPNSSIGSITGEEWDPSAVSRFEELTHVAQWKKLLSRIATYKKKGSHRGSLEGREGSPVPGVELYDTAPGGTDINIALELVNEGHAKVAINFGDINRSHVLQIEETSHTSSSGVPVNLSSSSKTVTPLKISPKMPQQSVIEELSPKSDALQQTDKGSTSQQSCSFTNLKSYPNDVTNTTKTRNDSSKSTDNDSAKLSNIYKPSSDSNELTCEEQSNGLIQ